MLTEFKDAPHQSETSVASGAAKTDNTEELDVSPARAALVEQWQKRVVGARKFWKDKAFNRMDKCMQIVAEGGDDTWTKNEDNYVVPVLNRKVNVDVAQLYARDPRVVAKRRRKRLFTIWDGDPATYQAALAATQPPPTVVPTQDQMTGQPILMDMITGQPWEPDPNAQSLVQEVQAAQAQIKMMDGLGETLEILWDYYAGEQASQFKAQMKALVRRVKTNGVAYVKLLFQRELQRHPEVGAKIDDATSQLAVLEQDQRELQEGDIDENSAQAEELRLLVQKLQTDEYVVAREGPIWDFPRSDAILVDPKVVHLKTFTGADWSAHEIEMTPEEVEQIYGIEVKGHYTEYRPTGEKMKDDGEKVKCIARVYEIEHKKNCETLAICEGYPDFLREPGAPDVKIERFWTIFPLIFNEIEHKDRKIPPSDVWMLRHPQSEINRSRESLREHRIASRPKYGSRKGSLDRVDKEALQYGAAHSIVELKAMVANDDINKVLQPIRPAPIDPNIYSIQEHWQDIQRVGGNQEANFGGTSRGSATEASISEQSRSTTATDNVDDLDDLLTEMAKAFAQLCLMELSKETVVEIVGPGAVWPDSPLSREEARKDLWLEIRGGSSGRPNAAAELQKLERAMPFLLQLPGLPPKPLAEQYIKLLDIGLQIDDIFVEGMPSITAINAMQAKAAAQPATGNPATNPADQGPQGGQNAPKPAGTSPQGQPAFPTEGGNIGR